MSFLETTDVETVRPGLSFSRSSEGRLINRGPAGGAGRFPGSARPQAVDPSPRFKCASHFHGAEHAQTEPSLAEREKKRGEASVAAPILLPKSSI